MEKPESKSDIVAQGTEDQQSTLAFDLPSKSAIRQDCKKQMALLRQEARLIGDEESRKQILKIIRSSLAVIDDDYDQKKLFEIAQERIASVRGAVSVELARNKVNPSMPQVKIKRKNLKFSSEIVERTKKVKAQMRAQLRSLISQLKKSFREKMAELAEQAAQIENETHRTDLLDLKDSFLRDLREYRDWDELLEFVESSTDMLRTSVAVGLYGHFDPRTKEVFKRAQARAMDRAMRANHRDT
jgi:hypothetical protein